MVSSTSPTRIWTLLEDAQGHVLTWASASSSAKPISGITRERVADTPEAFPFPLPPSAAPFRHYLFLFLSFFKLVFDGPFRVPLTPARRGSSEEMCASPKCPPPWLRPFLSLSGLRAGSPPLTPGSLQGMPPFTPALPGSSLPGLPPPCLACLRSAGPDFAVSSLLLGSILSVPVS